MGKVSGRTALAGADVATTDLVDVVDVSATTSGSKKMTFAEFIQALAKILDGTTAITGATVHATQDKLLLSDNTVAKSILVTELQIAMAALATAITSGFHATQDTLLYDDNGVAKKVTVPNLANGFFEAIATEMTGSGATATDEYLFSDGGTVKTITVLESANALWPGVATEMTGSGAAAADEYLYSDAGVSKTITIPESVAAQFAAVTTSMLGSDVAPAVDEVMASDNGVPKTMTFDELISAIALNGFATLSDISGPHADQAAAATAITGTGKLWYQTTTGLLGITLT